VTIISWGAMPWELLKQRTLIRRPGTIMEGPKAPVGVYHHLGAPRLIGAAVRHGQSRAWYIAAHVAVSARLLAGLGRKLIAKRQPSLSDRMRFAATSARSFAIASENGCSSP